MYMDERPQNGCITFKILLFGRGLFHEVHGDDDDSCDAYNSVWATTLKNNWESSVAYTLMCVHVYVCVYRYTDTRMHMCIQTHTHTQKNIIFYFNFFKTLKKKEGRAKFNNENFPWQ